MRKIKIYDVEIELLCNEHIEVDRYNAIKNISENANFIRLEKTGTYIYIPVNRVKYMTVNEVKI